MKNRNVDMEKNMEEQKEEGQATNQEELQDDEFQEEQQELQSLTGEVEKLKEDLKNASDKYLRQVAEFENFRKRTAKEKMELRESGGEEVVKSILEVLDDVDRAESQFDKENDIASLKTGILLIFNKLRSIMDKQGLKKMECLGEVFDPELQEALAQVPAAADEQREKIVDVLKPGYYLKEKLIRHAQVVVAK